LKSFLVHKDFVCFYSAVLKAAFSSEYIEGKTQTYRLEDTTEDAVRLLVHWLYTQKLDIHQLDELKDLGDIAKKEEKSLVELCVRADRLFIRKLQNDVICLMEELQVRTEKIPTSTFPFVWENTQTTSPLRRYLLDGCIFDLDQSWFQWSPDHFPKEMLLELATDLLAMHINGTEYKRHKARDMAEYKVPEE
jgi:hypothetical protein